MKKTLLIATGLIMAAATQAMDTSDSGVFGRTEMRPELVNILEFGGGPVFFSTRQALRRGLGDSRAEEEIKKLETQFGEGRVYRFLAVSDFMFMDAYRVANLLYGTPYTPTAGAALKDFKDSKQALDRIMGSAVHSLVMEDVDRRFGPGAADNFHTIADALGTSVD